MAGLPDAVLYQKFIESLGCACVMLQAPRNVLLVDAGGLVHANSLWHSVTSCVGLKGVASWFLFYQNNCLQPWGKTLVAERDLSHFHIWNMLFLRDLSHFYILYMQILRFLPNNNYIAASLQMNVTGNEGLYEHNTSISAECCHARRQWPCCLPLWHLLVCH